MHFAFRLQLAASVSHVVGLLLGGEVWSQARLRVQEQAKHQRLVFVDAAEVGYCTDIVYANKTERSPCRFCLLG